MQMTVNDAINELESRKALLISVTSIPKQKGGNDAEKAEKPSAARSAEKS